MSRAADPAHINQVTEAILGAAFRVHSELGPGLLESIYEQCLAFELASAGVRLERQKPMPVVYRGRRLDRGYRVDLFVEDLVIVEVKAMDTVLPIHEAQVMTYQRLADLRAGLLLNFNVLRLKDGGIKRIVHRMPDRG